MRCSRCRCRNDEPTRRTCARCRAQDGAYQTRLVIDFDDVDHHRTRGLAFALAKHLNASFRLPNKAIAYAPEMVGMTREQFDAAMCAPAPDRRLMTLVRRFNYAMRRTRDIDNAMAAVNEFREDTVTYREMLDVLQGER